MAVTKQKDIDPIVAASEGRIDALANVAGINDDFSPLHEISKEIRDRVIAIKSPAASSSPVRFFPSCFRAVAVRS